jgi:hypothetical protein
MLGVVRRDGQADLDARLKAAVGREESKLGRGVRIRGREGDTAVVEPSFKVGVAGPCDDKVHLEEVVLLFGWC